MPLSCKSALTLVALPMAICWSSAALASCKIDPVAALDISMASGVPVTDGEIDGHPVRFVIDSDAFDNVIPRELARKLRLQTYTIWRFDVTENGRDVPAYGALADRLDLSGSTIIDNRVRFVLDDRAGEAAGIIGQNVLARRDVEYDLAHGMARLSYSIDCLEQTPAYWADNQPVRTVQMERTPWLNRHTVGTVIVNGAKLHASFDTTAPRSDISLKAANKLGMNGAGAEAKVDLNLGGETYRGATLRVVDYDDPDVDMRIGLDFFLTHRVYVANDMHRIYFTYSGGPVFGTVPEFGRRASAQGN